LSQHSENLIGGANVGHRAAHFAVDLAALLVNHNGSAERNVLVFVAFAVQQPVLADNFGAGVTQNRNIVMRSLFPDLPRVLLVVDADGNQLSIYFVEIRLPLRELAQLFDTEGSPVSAIEVKHHLVTFLR
jgi:hypothetical protein